MLRTIIATLVISVAAPAAYARGKCARPIVGARGKLKAKRTPKKKATPSEAKDYWKSIKFGSLQFREVRRYVQHHYVDANVNTSRAWARAAEFALASAEGRDLLLLPQRFFYKRCTHPDERGLLAGRAFKTNSGAKYVIVEGGKVKDFKRRLSDDEIRALRKKLKRRTQLLEAEWKRIKFGERDFERVMRWAKRRLGNKWRTRYWHAAAAGYLYALDPHSSLIAKKAWDDAASSIRDSSFQGIGAVLTQRATSDYTIVETPMEGYPAAAAGLRAGDVILAVDGKSTKKMALPLVVKRIRGKANTPVVLTVERVGHPKPLSIRIVRKRVVITNVSSRFLPGYKNVGYVKLRGFIPHSDRAIRRAISKLQRKAGASGLRGLVLDLRGNGGGLLQQAVQIADMFLSRGQIVAVKSRRASDNQRFYAKPSAYKFPLVVLVNDGSASAAEIVTSALQEHNRAVVVGDRTFGKASVQVLLTPMFGSDYFIKLTTARYYTGNGRGLQIVGVHPDALIPPNLGDKKMPLGFREENLSNHLAASKPYTRKPNKRTRRALRCAKRYGKAKQLGKRKSAIKFDYQRAFAADVIQCLAKGHPSVKGSALQMPAWRSPQPRYNRPLVR